MNRHQNTLKDMLEELQYKDDPNDTARINALLMGIHAINALELLKGSKP